MEPKHKHWTSQAVCCVDDAPLPLFTGRRFSIHSLIFTITVCKHQTSVYLWIDIHTLHINLFGTACICLYRAVSGRTVVLEHPTVIQMKSVIFQTIAACVHETWKQKKVAGVEEESRRQLQLADGGLDVKMGSKKKLGGEKKGGENWTEEECAKLDVSTSPPNGKIMSPVHLPLNHNQPIGSSSVRHSHLYSPQN